MNVLIVIYVHMYTAIGPVISSVDCISICLVICSVVGSLNFLA